MTAAEFRNTADTFTKAYLEAALWSSTDDNDTPLDSNYDIEDVSPETLDSMMADCATFQAENSGLLTDENYIGSPQYSVYEIAGHDFWLTRNGHGSGFWDGDWESDKSNGLAGPLTRSCKAYVGVDLYIDDDGKVRAI